MNKKNIIIIGGSGQIGKSLTKALVQEDCNLLVGDKDINLSKNILHKNNIELLRCDVNKDQDIDKLINTAKKKFKKIDAVIYCAYPRSKGWGSDFLSLKRRYLNEDLNAHLGSLIIFSQKIIKLFLKQNYGNIINFSSIQGVSAPKFQHYKGTDMISPIEYSMMKSGIIMMTKYLAKLYKKKNIRVNCISPGGIIKNQNKEFIKNYKKDCGTKGMLDPEDLNSTISYLLSDESKYVTGQNIIIDDGWSL